MPIKRPKGAPGRVAVLEHTSRVLKGNRLDEVASLSFKNNVFVPGELTSTHGVDELPMVAQDPSAVTALKPERGIAAKVTLRDGRVIPSTGSIDAPTWLWSSVVDLIGIHERAYLEHCRRYALALEKLREQVA